MNIDSLIEYIKREMPTKKVENIQVKDEIHSDLGTIQSFSFTYDKNKKGYLVQGNYANVYGSDYNDMTSDNALLYFVGRKTIVEFLQIENEYPLIEVIDSKKAIFFDLEFGDQVGEVVEEFKFLGEEDLSEIKIYSIKKDNKDYWCVLDKQDVFMYIPKVGFELKDDDYLAMHYGVELRILNERIKTKSEEESKKRA